MTQMMEEERECEGRKGRVAEGCVCSPSCFCTHLVCLYLLGLFVPTSSVVGPAVDR